MYNIVSTTTLDGYQNHLMQHHVNNKIEDTETSLIDICDCRYKMVVWCYDLLEFCSMKTDTVEFTMSIIDPFMFVGGDTNWINHSIIVRNLCIDACMSAWTNKKIYIN
jgi:hypothetical protein